MAVRKTANTEVTSKTVASAKAATAAKKATKKADPKYKAMLDELKKKAEAAAKAGEAGVLSDELNEGLKALPSVVADYTDQINAVYSLGLDLAEMDDITQAFKIQQDELDSEAKEEQARRDAELQAIVDAKNARVAELDQAIIEKTTMVNDLAKEYKERDALHMKDMKTGWERTEAEYQYNMNRQHQIEADRWNDCMNAEKKALQDEKDAFQETVNDTMKKAERFAEMEATIAELKALADAKYADGVKVGESKAKDSYGYEVRYLKKEQEGALALAQQKNASLESTIADLKKQLADTNTQLAKAYERIESISKAQAAASQPRYIVGENK